MPPRCKVILALDLVAAALVALELVWLLRAP